ncbi:microfibril-associated glycoprotein 4-like isoform X2 [Topomyia yanbarensis]|uniref:microfibril-associated glycoprotein 4-like isoform X2 n=1 Tax=Topomyia yanbarensis TaxID=2498891 RepID=UPI00273C366D|nr:microfibril-associated glycoprotein 4-like isoform X2 [Topomyia yanbarensis]
MVEAQILTFACWLVLLTVSHVVPSCCSTFGYELLAARLESLENVALNSKLKFTEDTQSLRSDLQTLTTNIQSVAWNKFDGKTRSAAEGRVSSTTGTEHPRSCDQILTRKSAPYYVDIFRGILPPFEVYCDQEFEGGGWLVFQNRYNGAVDFYRSWREYKEGFGSLDGEFWLGLEKLHQITYSDHYELAIVMEDFHGETAYARYSSFAIGGEAEMYNLIKLGTYSGSANDSLIYHAKAKFSTFDSDNDENPTSCAMTFFGAWWYKSCHTSNLNSRFVPPGSNLEANKMIVWRKWKGDLHTLKKTRMMIRRIQGK